MILDSQPSETCNAANHFLRDALRAAELQCVRELLRSLDGWETLDINYHPPRVERLFRPWGDGMRLALHCIHPCTAAEALFHPHPWPSAVDLLEGSYLMPMGAGPDEAPPPIIATLELTAGAQYTMAHPDGWHAVAPIARPAYSVMLMGKPWDRWSPRSESVLHPIPKSRAEELRKKFASLLRVAAP
ncbi:hypothetical protein HY632_00275 [Candidatus Uhrbacteria bacterium]|nr:hypothetical protein [Candidatus Uhrbacteria bacterium]